MDAEILHHFCVLPTEITLLLKKLRDTEILRLYEFRGTLTFNLQIERMQKFCMHALFFWLMFNQTKILFTNANLGACKNSASLCSNNLHGIPIKKEDAEILRLYEFRGTFTFNLQIERMQKFCMP